MDTLHDLVNVQLGGYPLFLSNWPERLNESSLPEIGAEREGMLWHYISPDLIDPTHLRMYIWHENKGHSSPPVENPLNQTVYLAVTLLNSRTDVTLRFLGAKRQISTWDEQNDDPLGAGKCLAKSTLGGTLDSFPSRIPNVSPQSTIIIQKHTLANKAGIGVIYDLTIQPMTLGQTYSFELRTVASTNGSDAHLKGLTGLPVTVPTNNGGGRGYWQNNLISAEIEHGMQPANPGEHWSITRPGGPDQLFTSITSADPVNAHDNPGNYGVIYDPITIKLSTATQPAYTAHIRLVPRYTNAFYAGAVDRGNGTKAVPKIKYDANTNSAPVVALQNISVPGGGVADPWSFKLMHAGGATMPVSLLLSTNQ